MHDCILVRLGHAQCTESYGTRYTMDCLTLGGRQMIEYTLVTFGIAMGLLVVRAIVKETIKEWREL